jgi:acyl-coenzyme A thioesterase PaaI-like protein
MARPLGTRGGTIESKTNFFSPATGPVVRGECVALHVGRTTSVWQTTFTNRGGKKRRTAGEGKGDGIVAIVIQTQIGLPRSNENSG